MEFHIRSFDDVRDRPGVLALYRAAWHEAYASIDGADVIDRLIGTLSSGDKPQMFEMPEGDIALVAEHDGQIVGGARAHPRSDAVHISGLYVLPNAQRAGVGDALLAILFGRFAADVAWRTDVRPETPAALAFYRRHGFREVGRGRAEVGGGMSVDMIELMRPATRQATEDLWSAHHAKHPPPNGSHQTGG